MPKASDEQIQKIAAASFRRRYIFRRKEKRSFVLLFLKNAVLMNPPASARQTRSGAEESRGLRQAIGALSVTAKRRTPYLRRTRDLRPDLSLLSFMKLIHLPAAASPTSPTVYLRALKPAALTKELQPFKGTAKPMLER